jgi:cell filamentation protein
MPFDPFGDFETRGYLRNVVAAKDPDIIRHLEKSSFEAHITDALKGLQSSKGIRYAQLTNTHRELFKSVYPWAGQDRSTLAPGIAVAKAGYTDLFAHPADVRRAADYALDSGNDKAHMQRYPGEVFGTLAYAHPFLEGNGRTILTVHSELCRRADIHIAWDEIAKADFIKSLTEELRKPGSAMDRLVGPYIRAGAISIEAIAQSHRSNPGLSAGQAPALEE